MITCRSTATRLAARDRRVNLLPTMKRKFLINAFCLSAVLLLWPQGVIVADLLQKSERQSKTILLDPWFGGKEKGSRIDSKYAKEITLQETKKIQELLESQGFKVLYTRRGDDFITLEQRVMIGQSKGVNLHIAIKVSKAQSECIKIFFASPTVKNKQKENQKYTSEELNEQLGEILDGLLADSIREESQILGGMIRNKLNDQHVFSVELLRGADYLLKNVHQPTVMIDYRIVPRSDWKSMLEKIARLIADSIKEHYDQRTLKERDVI